MNNRKRLIAAVAAIGISSAMLVAGTSGITATAAPAATNADGVAQAKVRAAAYQRPPTKIGQTIPLRIPAPKNKSVVYFLNGTPAAQLINDGVKKAAESGGWKFTSMNYKSENPATLQAAMMTALQQNPTGVIVSGETADTWGASVTAAYANAKIPIIAGSTCPVKQVGPIFPGAATCLNPSETGRLLADWFIADSNGRGNALLQSMPAFDVFVVLREAFKAELAAKCPLCKLTVQEVTLAQLGAGQIPSALVNTLRTNPDIGYLFFDLADWSTGITPALAAAGLTNRVKVGGVGLNEAALDGLKSGAQVVWTATSFTNYGYANFDSLLRVITGSSGISKNGSMPLQLFTQANANTASLPYMQPSNSLALYRKLWRWQ